MTNYIRYVMEMQTEKRFKHTMGVVEMAMKLAKEYNVNYKQCEVAALLHDITKQAELSLQMGLLDKVNDDHIKSNKPLWHSYTGAVYASEVLNVTDETILDAIKYHTTGKLDLDDVGKVIYLSDYLEQGRNHTGIESERELIGKLSLDQLFKTISKKSIEHEISMGHSLHPDTKELYESII